MLKTQKLLISQFIFFTTLLAAPCYAFANPIAIFFFAPSLEEGVALSLPIGILEGLVLACFFKVPDKKFGKRFLYLFIIMTVANVASSLVGILFGPLLNDMMIGYRRVYGNYGIAFLYIFLFLYLIAVLVEFPFLVWFYFKKGPKAVQRALCASMVANLVSYTPFCILTVMGNWYK